MTNEQMQKQIERLLENPAFGENVVYIDSGLNEFPIRAFVYRNGVSSNQVRFDRGTEGKVAKIRNRNQDFKQSGKRAKQNCDQA